MYFEATGIVPSMPGEEKATQHQKDLAVWYQWGRDCIWHMEAKCTHEQFQCPRYEYHARNFEEIQAKIEKLESEMQNAST